MRDLISITEGINRRLSRYKICQNDIRLNRHIVVIESDDWGSIRMPSIQVLSELKEKGYRYADNIGYDRYDTLASNQDLEFLIEVLSSVQDSEGNPAKLTMNCVVANPDFTKIKASGYREYYYEVFTETLKRYPHHDRSFSLWKEGMRHGVLHPQFHGREHLNPQMWLKLLQKGVSSVVDSFERGVISGVVDKDIDPRLHVLAAFNVIGEDEYPFVKKTIIEGLDIFEQLFGYRSRSMIAPNYTWDTAIEETAATCGVHYLQGSRYQRHSQYIMRNGGKQELHYIGQRNESGQVYLIRNCLFEPSEYANLNADACLSEISKLFKNKIPAIISSHRQNFIGELFPKNRDENIREFKLLLNTLVKKYPDIVFLTSDELGKLISNE